jgi:hypothetical protein
MSGKVRNRLKFPAGPKVIKITILEKANPSRGGGAKLWALDCPEGGTV